MVFADWESCCWGGLTVGLVKRTTETDLEKLWVEHNSRVVEERLHFNDKFARSSLILIPQRVLKKKRKDLSHTACQSKKITRLNRLHITPCEKRDTDQPLKVSREPYIEAPILLCRIQYT